MPKPLIQEKIDNTLRLFREGLTLTKIAEEMKQSVNWTKQLTDRFATDKDVALRFRAKRKTKKYQQFYERKH